MRSCQRAQCQQFYSHSAFEANWKVKKLNKWVPQELTENKKKLFWSVFFSYSTKQWTISLSDCDMWQKVDFIQQPAMTSSVVGLRRSSKALSQSQTCTQKNHGHCMSACCASDPQQLSKFQRNYYIWEVCRTNQWDALKAEHLQPALVNRKGSILLHDNAQLHIAQPVLQKYNEGQWNFASSAIFT